MLFNAVAILGENQACPGDRGLGGEGEGGREQPHLLKGLISSIQLGPQGQEHQDLANHQEAGSRGRWSRARPACSGQDDPSHWLFAP